MPHPKQKHSHARTHKRRAHHSLTPIVLATCSHCGEKNRPHTVCPSCGYYKKRNVLDIEEKHSRREERALRRRQKQEEKRLEEEQSGTQEQTVTNKEATT